MNTRVSRYILKVAETGSITAVAKDLFMTQPALSQHIAKVEDELQLTIFDRSSGILNPTYEGGLYLNYIQKIVDLEDEMLRMLQDVRNNTRGQIVIGISTMRSPYILPRILPQFHKMYPHVQIKIQNGNFRELEAYINDGKVDVGFVSHHVDSSWLETVPLIRAEVIISIPRWHFLAKEVNGEYDWKKRAPVDMKQLAKEPFILNCPGQGFRMFAEKVFSYYKIQPPIVMQAYDYTTIRMLSQQGLGFAFVEDLLSIEECKKNNEVYYRMERDFDDAMLYLCYKKDRYMAQATKDFIQLCKGCISND